MTAVSCSAEDLRSARPTRLRAQLCAVGGVLPQAVGGQQKRTDDRRGLWYLLQDEQGRIGIGEASPLPGFSPDSLADCAKALQALGDTLQPVDFDADGWPRFPSLHALPAARCAIETAYGDLWAQRLGPAGRLSTVLSAADVPARSHIPINALCNSLAEAQAAVAAGAATLKLKLGGADFEGELQHLSELRRALPAGVALRIDVNGAWTLEQARERLPRLAALRLQFVEQPVAAGRGELCRLGSAEVPIAADESLQDADERQALFSQPFCVAWVVKPMLLGLRGARALSLQAQAHGRGVVITHAFDGPVAHAAACELAFSLPQSPWACGLAPHAGLQAWPQVALPHLARSDREPGGATDGYVLHAPSGPGLGFVDRTIFSDAARALGSARGGR